MDKYSYNGIFYANDISHNYTQSMDRVHKPNIEKKEKKSQPQMNTNNISSFI